MPVPVAALSSFMMFPCLKCTCLCRSGYAPSRWRARVEWHPEFPPPVGTANRDGVIWRQPRIFFRFSQTKYQLRKMAGFAVLTPPWRWKTALPAMLATFGKQNVEQRPSPAGIQAESAWDSWSPRARTARDPRWRQTDSRYRAAVNRSGAIRSCVRIDAGVPRQSAYTRYP